MHKLIPIVLVLLITIPFAFSSTDLTLNLDSNQIGINQVFSGTLDIDLDDSIDSNSLIDFYINDNFAYAVSLKDALKGQSISITKESYKDTNTNVNSVDYDFERAGKLINAALKFDDNANKLTITNNLSFKIEGINNPDQVSIDLNNDGIIDYTYKGELINKFEDLDKSNLAGKTEPESYTSIEAEGLSSYCVETIVKPSSSYKIITIAKKGEGWSSSVPLSGTISDTLLSSPSCGSDDTGCCTFSQKTSSQEVSCNLKKIYDSEQKVYLCLFVLTGNMDELPFEIGYFKDSSVKKSYINGKLTDKNFFIYGQRQLFNTVLNTKVEVQKEYVELKKILNTSSPTLPIAIYSKSAGIVRLSDVKFQYKTDVPITLSTFTKLTYTPELINNKTISIQLNKLLNLTSTEISEDSEIYAVFNGETSNTENFDVVEGARLLIQKTTENAYLGQNVEFAAHSDEDITYAVWDFGDNATATGEKVSHIYSKEGTYTVSLTVRDDLNISSTASTTITVANLKDSLVFLVTDTYERLKSINEKIASSSDKEVLSYLDLVNQMQGFSANLTLINNSVISTLSGNLTGTALDTKLMSIKTQLDDIRSKLITDFSVSSVSFTPKAYDSSQIPSSVTLGRDEDQFQERVLKAQESASVSGIVYTLTLSHLGSESKQVIVKKTASGGGKYYELI